MHLFNRVQIPEGWKSDFLLVYNETVMEPPLHVQNIDRDVHFRRLRYNISGGYDNAYSCCQVLQRSVLELSLAVQ